MTPTASLFSCAGADVSLDRVRDLVGQGMPESLTLEYKQEFSKNLVTTVAAMANSREQGTVFEEAQEVFTELGVSVHNLDDVDAVGAQAVKLLRGASSHS
jgi:hypothetical protein